METILNWIGSNQVIAWIGSLVLGMTAVWKVVERFSPKIRKIIRISGELLDVTNALLDAIEDKKIDKAEVEKIAEQIEELQEALK